ncbi:MAG: methyltransferase, partial [Chloroflexota bacterium]|nr:methyltransferase [Chloroflexota bacterium]
PRRFAATPLSQALREDAPHSVRHFLLMNGCEIYRAWGEAAHSVRTGSPAFERVFGASHFDYLSEHPEAAAVFNRAMAEGAAGRAAALIDYAWEGISTVVDVGGGDATLLTRLLAAHPQLRGVAFDLPHAREAAEATIGAAALDGRCAFLTGDFFADPLPPADAYLLAQILHDWDDDRAGAILRNCRRSLGDRGRLLLWEAIVPEGPEPHPAKLIDLQMLIVPGGRERTETEWRQLLAESGFRLTRTIPAGAGAVLEAVPGPAA